MGNQAIDSSTNSKSSLAVQIVSIIGSMSIVGVERKLRDTARSSVR